MRVYLPATLPLLARALEAGAVGPAPLAAFAVTPALREWYAEGDLEELEYAATIAAGRAALRLLEADPQAPRRRVVLAADVPDGAVRLRADTEPAAVELSAEIPFSAVASAHVDDPGAGDVIAAAADAVLAADVGDDDARFAVDEAEAQELQWYATQELGDLVTP